MILKNIFWSFSETIGIRLFSIIIYFSLVTILKPEDFGLATLSYTFINFSFIFSNSGFRTFIIQTGNLNKVQLNSIFLILFVSGLFFSTSLFLLAPYIANIFREVRLRPILMVLSPVFFVSAITQIHYGLIEKAENFRIIAESRIFSMIFAGVSAIFFAVNGFGVWALIYQYITGFLFSFLYIFFRYPWLPGYSYSLSYISSILYDVYQITLISLVNYANRHLDDLIIGYSLGTVMLGYYSIAFKIYSIINDLANITIARVSLPAFSRENLNKDRQYELFFNFLGGILYLTVPIYSLVIISSTDIVNLLFGETWQQSIIPLQILSVGGILLSMYATFNSFLLGKKKNGYSLSFNAIMASLSIILLSILAPMGIIEAALATPIRGLIMIPISIYLFPNWANLSILKVLKLYNKPVIYSIISVILYCLMELFISGESYISFILKTIVYMATFIVIFFFYDHKNYESLMNSLLNSRKFIR